ncbi:hypothetical protein AB834_05260 [PVC group bacterium (ex Bugula neritina AB1)]|nr:hypothetical protein AB834_05260 [PVC group bacterium (ex Bugula neritina AB1)]
MKEFHLIDQIKKTFGNCSKNILGIGDDCAVLPKNKDEVILISSDMLVENTHFLTSNMTYRDIGRKAAAVNLSDIAAMGGHPEVCLCSIGLPKNFSEKNVIDLYTGMKSINSQWDVKIIGGDTVRSDLLTINITILGTSNTKEVILRSGAKDGDLIAVTGDLGGSLSGKHYSFIPRVEEAKWLVKNCPPTSMIDISDGVAGDLYHILKASNISGASLDPEKIPFSKEIASLPPSIALKSALTDGEDFELLFTISPFNRHLLEEAFFQFSIIGTIDASKKGLFCSSGKSLNMKGFSHF